MMWRRGLIWYLLLAVVNGLLLVGIVNVWWGEELAPETARSRQGLEVPKAPILRDRQPLTAFQVISTKNLFSPERTGPEAGVAKKGQGSLEGGSLLGVIIVGEERAALIGQPSPRGPQQVQVVRLGEQFGGFQVLEITSEGVVFQGKAGKKTLGFPE
jgi:hypothetical protein